MRLSCQPEKGKHMSQSEDALLDAVTATLPPLLTAMEALGSAARRLHPPHLQQVLEATSVYRQPVVDGLQVFNAQEWPEHLSRFKAAIGDTAVNVLKAMDGLDSAASHSNPVMAAYSALRYSGRATEALYPVTAMLPPVSNYFLLESMRDDEQLQAKLAEADPGRDEVGILHAGNATDERGGFSLYVPEYYQGEAMPMVVALHGGSGHGRSFLWSWLKAARSLGFMVLSPTSAENTWSLMGPDVDSDRLQQMMAYIGERWNVADDRLLLTGMSDGGTFSYVSGLMDGSPPTALAPFAASFHPMLLEVVNAERLADLPIRLTHGARDWMFPVETARMAAEAFRGKGARFDYRELPDRAHVFPQDEAQPVLDWFLGTDDAHAA